MKLQIKITTYYNRELSATMVSIIPTILLISLSYSGDDRKTGKYTEIKMQLCTFTERTLSDLTIQSILLHIELRINIAKPP